MKIFEWPGNYVFICIGVSYRVYRDYDDEVVGGQYLYKTGHWIIWYLIQQTPDGLVTSGL